MTQALPSLQNNILLFMTRTHHRLLFLSVFYSMSACTAACFHPAGYASGVHADNRWPKR